MPCTATTLGDSEKNAMFGELMDVLAEPSSIAGLPGISINCGTSEGMPVGVQLIGQQFSESKLINTAKVFENK